MTIKSTAQRADRQVPANSASDSLSDTQKSALSYILLILQDYNEDLDQLRNSLLGFDAWFREYTKSDKWPGLTNDQKDSAHQNLENLRYLMQVMEEQGDILFPDGKKSPEIEIDNSKIQFA